MSPFLCRVLVIAPQPFYQDRGTPIAVHHTIQAMVNAGFEVDIATFDGGSDPDIQGLRVFRARSFCATSNLPIGLSWRKIVQHFALYRQVRMLLRTNRYAAIHAVEESIVTARLASRHLDIPVVYDMHSWLSDELSALPMVGRWPIQNLLRLLERWIVKGASAIFCSAGLGPTAQAMAVDNRMAEWFFPVQQAPLDSESKTGVRKAYGIRPDSKLVIYSGNLAAGQNVGLLVDSMLSLLANNDDMEIAVVGATEDDDAKLRALADPELRHRVHLIDRLPRRDALRLMAAADLALSLRIRGLNAPLKLFDYIGAGVPVVATNVHAHRVVLGDAAAYCQPVAQDVVRAVELLLADRRRYDEIRVKYAELAAGRLSRKAFESTVASAYRHICATRPLLTPAVR